MTCGRTTAPRRQKQALVTWLAIYPSITLVLWLFRPLGLLELPLPLRTLVLTALLVPAMVYVLVPILSGALDACCSRLRVRKRHGEKRDNAEGCVQR